MMESGLRSGSDIARTIDSGAEFTFLGRTFMYGVAAFGKEWADHTIVISKRQLQQVVDQICCERVEDFYHFFSFIHITLNVNPHLSLVDWAFLSYYVCLHILVHILLGI